MYHCTKIGPTLLFNTNRIQTKKKYHYMKTGPCTSFSNTNWIQTKKNVSLYEKWSNTASNMQIWVTSYLQYYTNSSILFYFSNAILRGQPLGSKMACEIEIRRCFLQWSITFFKAKLGIFFTILHSKRIFSSENC